MLRAALVTIALVAVACALVLGTSRTGLLEGTAVRATDELWPSGPTDDRVVVVGVDAASIDRTGQSWPWPRELQARLVDRLAAAGAAVVVLDVVHAPPREGDDVLAAALTASPPAVVALAAERVAPGSVASGGTRLLRMQAVTEPAPAVRRGAAAVGSAVVRPDRDGTVRRLPLLLEAPDGALIPSLSLAAVDLLDGTLGTPLLRPGAVRVDGLDVPVDGDGELTLAWSAGLDGSGVLSAGDVLEGGTPRGSLAGKVVLVGVTDPALGDRYVTPTASAGTPGVVLQAQAVNTLLTRSWTGPAPLVVPLLVTAGLSTGVAWVALRRRLRWLLLAGPVAGAVVVTVGVMAFLVQGWLPDVVRPSLAVGLAGAGAVAARALTEARERARVGALFRRYVPDAVADELVARGLAEDAREGQRLDVAVLFCDLRGFTPMAATRTPSEVRQVLDAYYEHVCTHVFARGGTVMQFVGDEVFAVFGAPLPMADPAAVAVDCAVAVQQAGVELERCLTARGLPPVRFGIGVHAGPVVAAHVGPESRRQYAVVGEAVNLGSRLCGVARPGEVVVSRTAGGCLVDAPEVRPDVVSLKGVPEPIAVLRIGCA